MSLSYDGHVSTGRGLPPIFLRLLLALAVGGVLCERLVAFLRAGPTDFDDAYMYLRYAHHALAGQWLVWNPGEAPVYGVTSLLHFLLVTVVCGLWPSLADGAVLRIASGAAALGYLVGLAALCARFCRATRLSGNLLLWAALLVPALGYGEAFFFHAGTGMDTMLAALANLAVAFASLRLAERPTPRWAMATAAIGLLAIEARPDNGIVAALCPLLALWLLAPASRLRPLLVWLGCFVGLVLLDLVCKWRWLGTPVPLAFYAKQPWYYQGFAGEFTWNPFLFLEVALAAIWPFLTLSVLFLQRGSLRLLIVLVVPAALTSAGLFSVNQIMGHLGRFFFPSLALLVLAGVLIADRWVQRFHGAVSLNARSLLVRLALALLVLLGGGQALEFAGRIYQARAEKQILAPIESFQVSAAAPLPELDSWQASQSIARLAAEAPAGTTLAMSEHGLVGASAARAIIIDVLGLHDAIFARQGFSAAELWRRQPDFIWMPHPDHTQMLRDIVHSPELWQNYVFYPEAFTYGVALRQNSPRYSTLAALFAKHWQTAYPGFQAEDYMARQSRK
jgi:hypothetical protein